MANPKSIRVGENLWDVDLAQEYLRNAEGQDPDFIAIKRAILIRGDGAYAAARRVFHDDITERSFPALLRHAGIIMEDIYETIGGDSTPRLIEILRENGEVHVPPGRMPSFQRACVIEGVKIRTDFRVTLDDDD